MTQPTITEQLLAPDVLNARFTPAVRKQYATTCLPFLRQLTAAPLANLGRLHTHLEDDLIVPGEAVSVLPVPDLYGLTGAWVNEIREAKLAVSQTSLTITTCVFEVWMSLYDEPLPSSEYYTVDARYDARAATVEFGDLSQLGPDHQSE